MVFSLQELFKAKLYEVCSKKSIQDLNGADLRLLVVKSKYVFAQVILLPQFEKFCGMMEIWEQIQWILYMPSRVSSIPVFSIILCLL